MIDGDLLRHVWEGVQVLAKSHKPPRSRLLEAALNLSASLLEPDKWPPLLLSKAEQLDHDLSNCGSYDEAISQMSDDQVGSLIEDFLDLPCDIERAIGRERPTLPSLKSSKPDATFTYYPKTGSPVSVNGQIHLFEYDYDNGTSFWFGVLIQDDREVAGDLAAPIRITVKLEDGREGTAQLIGSRQVDVSAVVRISRLGR